MLDAVARHPRAATVSVVLTTGTVSVVLAAGGVPTRRPPCTRADLWWADSLTSRRTGRPPRAAPSPRERYLFVARTVLVGRENGTYNVDRARTWLRESGRQVQPPCRGVRQLREGWPLTSWPRAATWGCLLVVRGPGPGPEVAGEAVAAAGGVLSGAGEAVLHIHPGPRRDCWRHSNVFPPQEAEVSRMNVQRGRRCTFILVPRPRPMGGSA